MQVRPPCVGGVKAVCKLMAAEILTGDMSDHTEKPTSPEEDGRDRRSEELLPLLYQELRRLAASMLAQERRGQTLQATALVHEAWLRVQGDTSQRWRSIKVCTLLSKPDRRTINVAIDYVGFKIPNKYVVGYGLDYQQKYRNLPYLAVLDLEGDQE